MAITRLYGPDYGEGGGIDRDYVASLTVPFYADSLSEAMFAALPNDTSLAENTRKRRWSPWKGGFGYIVMASFEGADPSRLDNDEKFSWQLDSAFSDRRLEANPNIQRLIKKYGGQVQDDGTIFWPLTYAASTGASSGFGSSKTTSAKNPMFGAESYLELNPVFRMTKLKSRESDDLVERVGTIKDNLPINVRTPDGRNWIITSTKADERGLVVTETEEWLISAPGKKWDADVYDLIVT